MGQLASSMCWKELIITKCEIIERDSAYLDEYGRAQAFSLQPLFNEFENRSLKLQGGSLLLCRCCVYDNLNLSTRFDQWKDALKRRLIVFFVSRDGSLKQLNVA
jgi:hypothetical protein